jgi:hypothetical protein
LLRKKSGVAPVPTFTPLRNAPEQSENQDDARIAPAAIPKEE